MISKIKCVYEHKFVCKLSENRIDEKAEGITFIYYSWKAKDHTLS